MHPRRPGPRRRPPRRATAAAEGKGAGWCGTLWNATRRAPGCVARGEKNQSKNARTLPLLLILLHGATCLRRDTHCARLPLWKCGVTAMAVAHSTVQRGGECGWVRTPRCICLESPHGIALHRVANVLTSAADARVSRAGCIGAVVAAALRAREEGGVNPRARRAPPLSLIARAPRRGNRVSLNLIDRAARTTAGDTSSARSVA